LGNFTMHETGLAKVYLYIKFEVSNCTRSKFMEEGLKFKILVLDPDHAPFRGILSRLRWDLRRSIRVPNLKFLVLPVPNLRKGV